MHRWQDYVLAVTAFGFSLALIPAIRSPKKPPVLSSLFTALLLGGVLIVYLSLSLWYSACMVALNLTAWLTLAIQEYFKLRTKKVISATNLRKG